MALWKCICLVLLSASMLSVAAAAPLRADTDIEVRRLGIPVVEVSIETGRPDAGDDPDWTVIDKIWSAAKSQDWATASDDLSRLKQQAPEWTPPRELTRLIEQGLRRQVIEDAVRAERWEDVLALHESKDVSCPDHAQFWTVSEALAKTDQMQTLRIELQSALEDCESAADEARIVDRAVEYLSLQQLRAFDQDARLQPQNRARLATRIQALDRLRAASEENWTRLATLARAHGARDATMQAAWALLESDPGAARAEFAFAFSSLNDGEAEYGAALAAYRDGDHRPALALSPAADTALYRTERAELSAYASLREATLLIEAGDLRSAEEYVEAARRLSAKTRRNADALAASISLARADDAYDRRDFQAAITFARAAEGSPQTRAAARSRVAWSHYQGGDSEAAYHAFSALYQSTESDAAADGLVLAASRAGWLDRLQPLATARSGPLLKRLKAEQARTALQRGDYLTAQKTSPVPLAELVGIDRPYVRQTVSVRSNDGAAGEGRVRSQVARTSLGFTTGQTHLEIGAVIVDMSAGTNSATTRSSDEHGVAPFLKVEREGAISVSAQVATTPSTGPVASKLTGKVAATRTTSDGLRADAALFIRGVDETLTSSFGREDAVTGETWGRVVETGIEASIAAPVNQTVSLQASATASQLDGDNIETNQAVKVGFSATKSLKAKGHAYLSVGPFYQFQAFDSNTNFHSPEHGGYFSPQSYHRAGLGVFGQTEDLKTWMVRYQVAGAIESAKTDNAPIRPLSAPNGAIYSGGSDAILAGSVRLELARRLNDEWTLNAGATAITSSAFNEVQAGIALKFVPGGKARVSARDLTPDLFSRDIL